jgi:predicted RNase H-like nuclease (RuvC/YqgF family)
MDNYADDNPQVLDITDTVDTVKTDSPDTDEPINENVNELLNLEDLIKNYVSQIENLRKEIKKQKDLFEDSFESDVVYREHEEKAKEAAKIKSETKQQILKQPTLAALGEKIDDLKTQLKELQVTLSDYLVQYQKMTGFNEIEVGDGETMIIVNSARLVKGSPKS